MLVWMHSMKQESGHSARRVCERHPRIYPLIASIWVFELDLYQTNAPSIGLIPKAPSKALGLIRTKAVPVIGLVVIEMIRTVIDLICLRFDGHVLGLSMSKLTLGVGALIAPLASSSTMSGQCPMAT